MVPATHLASIHIQHLYSVVSSCDYLLISTDLCNNNSRKFTNNNGFTVTSILNFWLDSTDLSPDKIFPEKGALPGFSWILKDVLMFLLHPQNALAKYKYKCLFTKNSPQSKSIANFRTLVPYYFYPDIRRNLRSKILYGFYPSESPISPPYQESFEHLQYM